jgi:hypothetical protein
VWNLEGKHGCTLSKYAIRDHSDEGWDSKVCKYTGNECEFSNAFNAIVETNGTSERVMEGPIVNPPE